MKHLTIINSDFIKEARKWKDLTYEEQKGYLSRHPKTKRRLTARPESGSDTGTEDESTEGMTYKEYAEKYLQDKTKSWMKSKIEKLQSKIDRRMLKAEILERRAQGDLDGTALDAARDRNEPLDVQIELMKHYMTNGDKKLPQELQERFDDLQKSKTSHKKRKLEDKKEKAKHEHLLGKTVHFKNKYGENMSGVVVNVKTHSGWPQLKLDNCWTISPDHITKTEKGEAKELPDIKDMKAMLKGKKITWESKKHPGQVFTQKVISVGSSRVKTDQGWKVPLSMIKTVDGKKFKRF